ncbi:cuticle protein 18.7-like [Anabrus simplex]|uniref:cuticle protein 18.7-like n=1 Tax=Anabrus simplex TaxID=316456 RepID=UPI0035A2A1D7
MKCLVVLCAIAAVAVAKPGYLPGGIAGLAGLAGVGAPLVAAGYAGPIAVPAITAGGVPVDTPEVQVARAAHAAAHAAAGNAAAAAAAAPGGAILAARGVVVGAPAVYAGPQHVPVLTAAGVPVDTPDVQAARAAHAVAQATSAAAAAAGSGGAILAARGVVVGAPAVYAGPQHIPVLTAGGVPVDTPEVQAARAADAAAHLAAKARLG